MFRFHFAIGKNAVLKLETSFVLKCMISVYLSICVKDATIEHHTKVDGRTRTKMAFNWWFHTFIMIFSLLIFVEILEYSTTHDEKQKSGANMFELVLDAMWCRCDKFGTSGASFSFTSQSQNSNMHKLCW